MASKFIWYELMTSDLPAAEKFYKTVVGWNTEDFGGGDIPYKIVKAGETGVGGLMNVPEEAAKMGAKPAWMGYIHAADVDAKTDSIKKAGGKVHRAPEDIPGVGRFSVVADPQGATFMLLAAARPGPAAGAGRHARSCRLARTLHRRLAAGARLLFRPVRLDQGPGDGHGRDGHLPAFRHRRRTGRRHDEPAAERSGPVSGASISMSPASTPRRSA